ncbi:MAG: phosphatase PAP2 family protein [Anaerolineae bacterium]|nr:phosphatase PAP2 family protein [Anaerolineae bacterium]
MTVPKDTHEADRVGMVRAGRILSNVISPPVMFALIGLALGVYERPFWPGLAWGFVFGLMVALVPLLVILYLMRIGRISELHMSNTSERHIPYMTSVITGMLTFVIITVFDGPVLLRCLSILSTITLGALGLINTKWLISIHATAAAATWLIATLIFGWVVGLIFLPFLVLISWVRLYLKRHTPAQVLAGIALGFSTVLLMRMLGCFIP